MGSSTDSSTWDLAPTPTTSQSRTLEGLQRPCARTLLPWSDRVSRRSRVRPDASHDTEQVLVAAPYPEIGVVRYDSIKKRWLPRPPSQRGLAQLQPIHHEARSERTATICRGLVPAPWPSIVSVAHRVLLRSMNVRPTTSRHDATWLSRANREVCCTRPSPDPRHSRAIQGWPGGSQSHYVAKTDWEPVDHVATHLGIISAVCAVALSTKSEHYISSGSEIDIVAVCRAKGRAALGRRTFWEPCQGYSSSRRWKGEITTRSTTPAR